MATVAKVTISLPADVLEYVDGKQRESGLSRSEVVRRAIEQVRREERERELDEQFIRGWQAQPETAEEFGWLEHTSRDALGGLPWEERDGGPRRDLVGQPSPPVGPPARPARRAG